MKKRLILSPIFILIILLASYEIYTSFKGRELLTAAHLMEGMSSAVPVKMQVAEFYAMQGRFPASNAELGFPPAESFSGRGLKSIEISLGGKITIIYSNAFKKNSSIILIPSSASNFSAHSIKWACVSESIEQRYFNSVSLPCRHVSPGALNKLMASIETENEAMVRKLILDGVNVNRVLRGDTPLMLALFHNHYVIAQLLVDAGADVDHKLLSVNQITPLIYVVGLGAEKFLALLLESGANIDAVDGQGKTALMHAIQKNRENMVAALLAHGADPRIKDNHGVDAERYAKKRGQKDIINQIKSADLLSSEKLKQPDSVGNVSELMYAASRGDIEDVKQLIRSGSAVDAFDSFNATALHYALKAKKDAVVNVLIESGASVNSVNRDGHTPLFLAVKGGRADIVAILLQAGATVNVEDRYNKSPFSIAVRYGYKRIVTLLLDAGVNESINKVFYEIYSSPASKECRDHVLRIILASNLALRRNGNSLEDLLIKAIQKNYVSIVRFLLKHNVDPELDVEGIPLLVATQGGAQDIMELLVKHGVDINAVNKKGQTALMLAVKFSNVGMVKYLLDAGAKVDIVDRNGLTALRMAKANYAENIVKLLRRH